MVRMDKQKQDSLNDSLKQFVLNSDEGAWAKICSYF